MVVRLPPLHEHQRPLGYWNVDNPDAQVLVAPCGTKTGKSFGAAWWMAVEAMSTPGLYCAWIAPTYRKAKIGFRYMRAFMPDCEWISDSEGKLEIRLANGSYITFLHGQDAEVTVEGEAVDRFVIDEAGKIIQQVWFSLLTTITQTRGKGIVTGTPRGHTWYYKLYKAALTDPMFVRVALRTEQSPYISKEAIEIARRLLPPWLFAQYYEAKFVSQSTVFGDLSSIWRDELDRDGKISTWGLNGERAISTEGVRFWLDPDDSARTGVIAHGVDLAKKTDYTVFYSVNEHGRLVGYCRFRRVPYKTVASRFADYCLRYFRGSENILDYDATGIGDAVGEEFNELFDDDARLDIQVNPVVFTNKLKSKMVSKTIIAIEEGWHKAPRIEEIEGEFTSYEVNVTRHGNHTYMAAEGEHDDIVSAAMMAITRAYASVQAEAAERLLESAMSGKNGHDEGNDIIAAYASLATGECNDDFFDTDQTEDDFDFDEEQL
jgi:hypothetical protein